MITTIKVPSPVSKSDEVRILTELAAGLGQYSYCGPWLASVAQEVAKDIANDFCPVPSVALARACVVDAQTEAAAVIRSARLEADRIVNEAKAHAAIIRQKSDERTQYARGSLLSAIETARRSLVVA
jgi:hypothetical protein